MRSAAALAIAGIVLVTATSASSQIDRPVRLPEPGETRPDPAAPPEHAAPLNPPLPDRVGCYALDGRTWRDAPCVDAATHYRYFPKAKTPPLSALVVKKYAFKDDQPIPKVAWTRLSVSIPAISTAADSGFGPGNWSVQNNTNFFQGSNGHIDAVQFLDISSAKWGDAFCIGEVDADTQDYTTHILCQHATRTEGRKLQPGDTARIIARAYVGGTGKHLLSMEVNVPWTKYKSDFGIVTEDHWGLYRRWIATSGTLLGYGNSSQLVFDKGIVKTSLEAVGCWSPGAASIPNCKNGYPLSHYMHPDVYAITGETNNLQRAYVPVPAPFFWNAPDYASRAVIHATPGACLDAVTKSAGKTLAC